MLIFDGGGGGGRTRKLRNDIIYWILSIRLSRSPIHCAFDPEDVIIGFEYGLQGSILR